jgi:hypothetical protein
MGVVVVVARHAAAEPCGAHVRLAGAIAAIDRVANELRALGVTLDPAPSGCPTVEASVELDPEGGIAVSVLSSGRTEGRVVSDPAMAAAWIDSWVHNDGAIAMAGPGDPSLTTAAMRVPSDAPAIRARVAPASSSFLDRTSISADYESVWTDDGSSWTGGSVSGCVRFGELCLGARVRASWEPSLTYNLATASRTDVAVLATASHAFALGRIVASPELGLGVGRMSTARVDCTPAMMDPMCPDPTDPMCMTTVPCIDASGKEYVGDGLHGVTYTPRLEAAIRIAVPLFDRVWLDGIAAVTFAPFGHSDAFPAHGTGDDADLSLPGEPNLAMQLGIGVRVGAP